MLLLLLLLCEVLIPTGCSFVLVLWLLLDKLLLVVACLLLQLLVLLLHNVLLHLMQAVPELYNALFELCLQLQQICIVGASLKSFLYLCQAMYLLLQLCTQLCF